MSHNPPQDVVPDFGSHPQMEGARGRTGDGSPLTPGVNVDRIDVANGVAAARQLGWIKNGNDEMVVSYCLARHARGEEAGAVRSWLSHFGKPNLTGWYVVLANAIVA